MPDEPMWRRYLHFWRRRVERDVDLEVRHHFDCRIEELTEQGLSPDEARGRAEEEFGDVNAVRATLGEIDQRLQRRLQRTAWWEQVAQDAGYALRGLRRSPGFTTTVVLTLAIGIGAAASMYGVLWRLLLQPPPHVVAPDHLVQIYQRFQGPGGETRYNDRWPHLFLERLTAQARSFEAVGAHLSDEWSLGTGTDARRVRAVIASGGYWRALGVRPRAGRFFTDEESHPATGSRVVVLSHALWQSYFGGTDAMGKVVQIRGQPFAVIGVAPRGFRGVNLEQVDVWVPLVALTEGGTSSPWYTSPIGNEFGLVGRLRPGASPVQSGNEVTTLMRPFFADMNRQYFGGRAFFPVDNMGTTAPLTTSLGRGFHGRSEARIAGWLVGVGVVLLVVACSNVAGLLLLRAMRRRREIAVRAALGMTRARLAALLLTEAGVLALIGGMAAVALLLVSGAWAERFVFPHITWERAQVIEPATLAVVAGSVVFAFLLPGVVALQHARRDVSGALKDGAPHGTTRRSAAHQFVLVSQAALSVVMLVGALLFVRSLRNLLAEDLGVDARRVYSVSIDFSGTGRNRESVSSFYERARERIRALPGIYQTSLALQAPLVQGARAGGSIRLPGHDTLIRLPGHGSPTINYVSEDFFATTGLRIVQGRPFHEFERDGSPVVIVNETMARLYWPGQDAVGQCVHVLRQATCTTVVGVVESQHMFLIREESHLFYYRPLPRLGGETGTLLLRSSLPPAQTVASVRRTLNDLEPGLPYVEVRELFSGLESELQPWRLGVSIFAAFGTLAVLLAAIGLSSAIAYTVTQRSREIGVRMAVGAKAQDVLLLVIRDGLRIGLLGVGAGVVIALLAGPRLGDLLYEVSPRDILVFGSVSGGVLAVALGASLVPARRATKVDPMQVLRTE